jgi:hypothetical protein
MPTISSLYAPDATKALLLSKSIRKNIPADVRNMSKVNANLTTQVLFITTEAAGPTVQVMSYPILGTDNTLQPVLIGIYGNDADNLAPISIPGNLLSQSTSTLVPVVFSDRYELPVLAEDPLSLDAPTGADQDRLKYVFTEADHAPTIAGIPIIFSVPIGITPPAGWVLNANLNIPEDRFECEVGRMWVNSMARTYHLQQGLPIHLDGGIFNLADLELAPFVDFPMRSTSIATAFQMLAPSDPQYDYARTVAMHAIQARHQSQAAGAPPANTSDADAAARENAALQRQALSIQQVVTAVIEANAKSDKAPQSRTDREATKAVDDTKARYQLMFARIEKIVDPNEPEVKILAVVLPVVNKIFTDILETSKTVEVVRMVKEQFGYHLQKTTANSRDFHARSTDLNINVFDGPFVNALKRAIWAVQPLSQNPDSVKSDLALYHLAPVRTGTFEYEERIAEANKTYRQESVGESKSRINAKATDLNHSGRLESETDLHSTIANLGALISFITIEAQQSELWKMIEKLHDIWLSTQGRAWIGHHIKNHSYIISAIILEFQQVLALYVQIANNQEYRSAVQLGSAISPQAYEEANESARHVITTMNNLIPGMIMGHLIMEPLACKFFYSPAVAARQALGATQRNDGLRAGSGSRRDEARPSARNNNNNNNNNGNGNNNNNNSNGNNNNNNNSSNNNSRNDAPELSTDQIATLKGQGLLKYNGTDRRIPPITNILEMNGSAGLVRLCTMTIYKDRFCRWGVHCKQKHVKRLSDLTSANKAKLVAYVNAQPHIEMVQTGTSS